MTTVDEAKKTVQNRNRYTKINKIILRKCRETKQHRLSEKSSELEALHVKRSMTSLKYLKSLRKPQKNVATILKDVNNKIIIGVEDT